MPPKPRASVRNLLPAVHGAFDFAELEQTGLNPDAVLDFSVNSNPYGPTPAVREALAQVPLDRYPDREALALRRVLAARLDVALDQILAGNGTAELLWLVGLAFLRPRDRVSILGPTFGEYSRVATMLGAETTVWRAPADRAFKFQLDDVADRLRQMRPRLVFVCNPNNPTGTLLSVDTIGMWASAHPDTLFVVDEAYLNFAAGLSSALALGADNVLILRSMTKDYALAGLRLGYAVGHTDVIDALTRVRPPWSVNALAQAAGVAALADDAHLERSLSELTEAKRQLVDALSERGLEPLSSWVHFFLVDIGDGSAFRQRLLRRGILVRDCASFGLPAYVRIATRRPEENTRLLAAIREVQTWSA